MRSFRVTIASKGSFKALEKRFAVFYCFKCKRRENIKEMRIFMQNLTVQLTENLRPKPTDESKLGFGQYFTDHMFVMEYDIDKGWYDAKIVPYSNISLDPAAMCLHYGQEVFEGMKAYRTEEGEVVLFRPEENFKRLNNSSKRLCIPQIDEKFALEALKELIKIDINWVPKSKDTSLYIRPFIVATDPFVGVRVSHTYKFIIILSPVGSYYPEGLNPVKIYVETNYVRAVRGGTGEAKTAANYAASLIAQMEAKEKNYSQVLWLDGVEMKYIEEVGTMNVFFVIGDEIITPSLRGSILPGITRKSCIELLRSWGMKVVERPILLEEVIDAYNRGSLKEIFGTGTAAVISPVGHLKADDSIFEINGGKIGAVSQRLYDALTDIQWGRAKDEFGWIEKV